MLRIISNHRVASRPQGAGAMGYFCMIAYCRYSQRCCGAGRARSRYVSAPMRSTAVLTLGGFPGPDAFTTRGLYKCMP